MMAWLTLLLWRESSLAASVKRAFALLLKQILYFDRYVKILAPNMNVFADDRIALPVSDTAACVHDLRALLNADAVLEHAPSFMATGVALFAQFLATQRPNQITALGFVFVDVLVDALVADLQGVLKQ